MERSGFYRDNGFRTWAAVLLVFLLQRGSGSYVRDEENLRTEIFANYSSRVRPEATVNVTVSCLVASLNDLKITEESLEITAIFYMVWTDSRLAWTSSVHGGIDRIYTAPEDIWTPAVVVDNAVDDVGVLGGENRDATPVTVSDVSTALYVPSGEFELAGTLVRTTNIPDPYEAGVNYRKVNFDLTFRRQGAFYVQNLILPILLNSLLMIAVFLLPIESGEKISYSITVLLSFTVFLTYITDKLPPVATDISILQVYLAVVLCLGTTAILLTVWMLHVYHKPEHPPPGKRYRKVALVLLAPCLSRLGCRLSQSKLRLMQRHDVANNPRKVAPLENHASRPLSANQRASDHTPHSLSTNHRAAPSEYTPRDSISANQEESLSQNASRPSSANQDSSHISRQARASLVGLRATQNGKMVSHYETGETRAEDSGILDGKNSDDIYQESFVLRDVRGGILSESEVNEKAGVNTRTEEVPLSWCEFAKMMDSVFLWVFSTLLVIVTIIIFGFLFQEY